MRRFAFCAAALVASTVALAQQPLVKSRDGRFEAIPIPDGAWCAETVGIRIEATPALLRDPGAGAQRFLTGVRAAINSDCPNASAIRFFLRTNGRTEWAAYTAKKTGWSVTELSATAPAPAPADAETLKRQIADSDGRLLALLTNARDVQFLDETGSAHAAWRAGDVAAALTIFDRDPASNVALKDQADAFGNQDAQTCLSAGGTIEAPVVRDPNPFRSARGFVCRMQGKSYAYGLIAYSDGPYVNLIGLYEPQGDTQKGDNLRAVTDGLEQALDKYW